MTPHTALLVDDDIELGTLLVRLFEKNAIALRHVVSVQLAMKEIEQTRFDAVILDIMLPDGSGLDYCRELRLLHPTLPILMLSARSEVLDRVLGLEIGADDYVSKPFDAAELVARVRTMLRRVVRLDAKAAIRVLGNMQIDLLARQVKLNNQTLDLTSSEYKLLLTLSESSGEPMSRDLLSRAIQPGAYVPSDRSVDVQIFRLRKKLSDADPAHVWITTVRGEGYVITHSPLL